MNGKKFSHVLTTHKHNDHSGGNLELKEEGVEIVGGKFDNVPGVTIAVEDK